MKTVSRDTLRIYENFRTRVTGEFLAYLTVSVLALAVDIAILSLMNKVANIGYLTSSATGYCIGAVLHYFLSVRFVFNSRRVANAPAEFALYSLIGLGGLAATQLILKLGVDVLGLDVLTAKVGAVGLSFVFNYGLRRALLFTVFRSTSLAK
jgi:putative flippase GtrA